MSFRGLDHKVVIVTGAAQGIGAAYARRLVEDGSTVIVADRNTEGARATADGLVGSGSAVAFGFDVASQSGCRSLADFASEECGRVDGLLNNAAIFSTIEMKPFWEITEREGDLLMAVTTKVRGF